MVDAKYATGKDVKILLEGGENILQFSLPVTRDGLELYTDLTMAKNFPDNHTPYSDAISELAPDADIDTYFLARDEEFNGATRQRANNLIEVNGVSGATPPATGMFFSMAGGGTTHWKGDSYAFRDSYDPGKIEEWVELSLDDVEAQENPVPDSRVKQLTDTSYENIADQTVPTLEFEEMKIPNPGQGNILRERAMESFHQALEDGEYRDGPPPSYVMNRLEREQDQSVMDTPRILSVMMDDQDTSVTGALKEDRTVFYIEPGIELPEHAALTYIVENGQKFRATDEFIERYSSMVEAPDTGLDPEEDPMIQ